MTEANAEYLESPEEARYRNRKTRSRRVIAFALLLLFIGLPGLILGIVELVSGG